LVWVSLFAGSLAGCGHAPARPSAQPPAAQVTAPDNRLAAEIAASMIGTPYRPGGELPAQGFDCSGLVRYCYRLQGLELPRTVAAQRAVVQPVASDRLAAGDLLFFKIGPGVSHVGIYYGDGQFVHAPSSGKAVMRSRLDDPYWRTRLLAGGRPVAAAQFGADSSPRSNSGVSTSAGSSLAATGALSRNP
jgi:cell wall-associated NlpC family hydrolase